MQFSDAEPLPAADVSEFVTYTTPEYQEEIDDGTDLPVPEIASLVMPPLEPRARRSRPKKLLRDTITEATPAESEPSAALESEDRTYGDGVVAEESVPQVKYRETPETASTQSTERLPAKSKRRRRRRGRGERGSSSTRKEATSNSSKAADDTTERTQPESSSAVSETKRLQIHSSGTGDSDMDSEGRSKPRKRRRRRRRRGPSKSPDGSSGDSDESGAAPSGGADA